MGSLGKPKVLSCQIAEIQKGVNRYHTHFAEVSDSCSESCGVVVAALVASHGFSMTETNCER